mgnify:FL=1
MNKYWIYYTSCFMILIMIIASQHNIKIPLIEGKTSLEKKAEKALNKAKDAANELAEKAKKLAEEQTQIFGFFKKLSGSIDKLFSSISSTNNYLNNF